MKSKADTFADGLSSILYELRADGHTSYRAMAREFNRRGVPSARGGRWHHSTLRNLFLRSRGDRFGWLGPEDIAITKAPPPKVDSQISEGSKASTKVPTKDEASQDKIT